MLRCDNKLFSRHVDLSFFVFFILFYFLLFWCLRFAYTDYSPFFVAVFAVILVLAAFGCGWCVARKEKAFRRFIHAYFCCRTEWDVCAQFVPYVCEDSFSCCDMTFCCCVPLRCRWQAHTSPFGSNILWHIFCIFFVRGMRPFTWRPRCRTFARRVMWAWENVIIYSVQTSEYLVALPQWHYLMYVEPAFAPLADQTNKYNK